jgi:hypothetical protein
MMSTGTGLLTPSGILHSAAFLGFRACGDHTVLADPREVDVSYLWGTWQVDRGHQQGGRLLTVAVALLQAATDLPEKPAEESGEGAMVSGLKEFGRAG